MCPAVLNIQHFTSRMVGQLAHQITVHGFLTDVQMIAHFGDTQIVIAEIGDGLFRDLEFQKRLFDLVLCSQLYQYLIRHDHLQSLLLFAIVDAAAAGQLYHIRRSGQSKAFGAHHSRCHLRSGYCQWCRCIYPVQRKDHVTQRKKADGNRCQTNNEICAERNPLRLLPGILPAFFCHN